MSINVYQCLGLCTVALLSHTFSTAQSPSTLALWHKHLPKLTGDMMTRDGFQINGGTPIAGFPMENPIKISKMDVDDDWYPHFRRPPYTCLTRWGFRSGRGSWFSVCKVRFRYLWRFNCSTLTHYAYGQTQIQNNIALSLSARVKSHARIS